MKKDRAVLLSCLLVAFFAGSVCGQGYPNKPIHVVVAVSPGGPNDVMARIVAQKLAESLGQSVLVDNKPGADNAIGAEFAARAAPDGYTLFWGETASLVVTPNMQAVRYDPVKDFEPITQVGFSPFAVLVNASLPVKSIKELIALAKSKSGQLNYGSGASVLYFAMEMFKHQAGIDMVHVSYKGAGPARTALLSGEVSVGIENLLGPLPYINKGALRALAILSAKRSTAAPDVPTMAESGFPLEASAWTGVLGPAGTPKEVVTKLHDQTVAILQVPSVKERLLSIGGDIIGSTPEAFAQFIKVELGKYASVAKELGIRRTQ